MRPGSGRQPGTVPDFEVCAHDSMTDTVLVTCGRKDCANEFTIGREWLMSAAGQTRPCPWCFRVSRVPR